MRKTESDIPEGAVYVIVRSRDAGVFAGYLTGNQDTAVTLAKVRRLWYWHGAASLSEMAVRGVAVPLECKFSVPVPQQVVLGVCEVLTCTPEAKACIQAVPEWTAHPQGGGNRAR